MHTNASALSLSLSLSLSVALSLSLSLSLSPKYYIVDKRVQHTLHNTHHPTSLQLAHTSALSDLVACLDFLKHSVCDVDFSLQVMVLCLATL